jgi:hypothetical protein
MGSVASPGVNSFPSFTLEFNDYEDDGTAATTANLKRTYIGCRVNSLTVSGSVDEPVKVAVDWLAKRVSVSTAVSSNVTQYTMDPFVFYDGYVMATSVAVTGISPAYSALKISTSALAEVLSFDVTVNNNCEAGWYITGTTSTEKSARGARYIIPKGRDYALKLGMHYKNKKLYQRFLGSITATTDQKTPTKPQIVIDLMKTGAPGIVADGTHHYCRMVFSSCVFDDIVINGSPEDIVGNDVTVFTKSVKAYFVDSVSSYK